MDRSQTYIRMCRRAAALQKRWVRQYGDAYQDEADRLAFWLHGPETEVKVVADGVCVTCNDNIIHLQRHSWLPRLDQLMELAVIPGERFEQATQHFHRWLKKSYAPLDQLPPTLFATLEQMWLAFVMQRRYGQRWDGRQWIGAHQIGPAPSGDFSGKQR